MCENVALKRDEQAHGVVAVSPETPKRSLSFLTAVGQLNLVDMNALTCVLGVFVDSRVGWGLRVGLPGVLPWLLRGTPGCSHVPGEAAAI